MKHKKWSYHFLSALFAFVLAVSSVGNLATGYDLPIDSGGQIIGWCAFFALVTSMLLLLEYGEWVLLCASVISGMVIRHLEPVCQQLRQQSECLIYFVSSHYHRVYDWPVFGNPIANEVSMPLILWAALAAICANWYFCRRKHITVAILPAVIPLLLCLVTTDRVPDPVCLYLLILGIAVLLITDWTRKRYPAQSIKLLFRTVLPVAVFLGVLFAWNPREEYVNRAGTIQNEVVSWFQKFQNKTETVVSGAPAGNTAGEKLNLRTVGPKNTLAHAVMRVTAPMGGTVYLRGRDYDLYTGIGWEASSARKEVFTPGGDSVGTLSIVTYGVRNIRFVPYYTTEEINLTGGTYVNTDNLQQYSYHLTWDVQEDSVAPESRYTDLPGDTLQWAEGLLKDISYGTISDTEMVYLVRDYVQGSAVYDLSTSRMDPEHTDFAQWFLEESDTGYCVHFATAATVLLRAAGIPARYVEGYMVSCSINDPVVVSNQDAHAWAEYYDQSAKVWRVLEATPAAPEEENIPVLTIPVTEPAAGEELVGTTEPETEEVTLESDQGKPDPGQAEEPVNQDLSGVPELQDPDASDFKILEMLRPVIISLIVLTAFLLQSRLRIRRKRMLWNRGKQNERTMARWRQTRFLAGVLKTEYPEDLDNLALKAQFSQHQVSFEELQMFETYHNSLIIQVQHKPWYCRIIFKWILAID